ncbi:SulA-like leucine-rich domain-containing protein [Rheinheimera soli]|uniref:Cell division inhibitor SulA n=1 Tax=Rheinheimera soli TaxID=443616 RepID=A0ABU1VUT2_9GAMM|nr:SulA-like leucine-rich domain-containing protein [Rheinheimera soli]MDR7119486.1 cell division inhibitor SulA [Rheinheimera soli]
MLNLNKAIQSYSSLTPNQSQHKTGQTAFYQKLQVTAGQLALPELLFIIQQHQQHSGWVLLLAPNQLPDKSTFSGFDLDMSKVLVIQQKQISNIHTVLSDALSSSTCSSVVVWQDQFSESSLLHYQQLAEQHQTCFYQLSNDTTHSQNINQRIAVSH